MMDSESTKLLKEILKWVRVGNVRAAREMLTEILDSEKKQRAYQATGESKTLDQITSEVKMSKSDLVSLFRRCESSGLMEQEGSRKVRIFDLVELGIIQVQKGKGAKKNVN